MTRHREKAELFAAPNTAEIATARPANGPRGDAQRRAASYYHSPAAYRPGPAADGSGDPRQLWRQKI